MHASSILLDSPSSYGVPRYLWGVARASCMASLGAAVRQCSSDAASLPQHKIAAPASRCTRTIDSSLLFCVECFVLYLNFLFWASGPDFHFLVYVPQDKTQTGIRIHSNMGIRIQDSQTPWASPLQPASSLLLLMVQKSVAADNGRQVTVTVAIVLNKRAHVPGGA